MDGDLAEKLKPHLDKALKRIEEKLQKQGISFKLKCEKFWIHKRVIEFKEDAGYPLVYYKLVSDVFEILPRSQLRIIAEVTAYGDRRMTLEIECSTLKETDEPEIRLDIEKIDLLETDIFYGEEKEIHFPFLEFIASLMGNFVVLAIEYAINILSGR